MSSEGTSIESEKIPPIFFARAACCFGVWTQGGASSLLQEVHPLQQGVEAGVGAKGGDSSMLVAKRRVIQFSRLTTAPSRMLPPSASRKATSAFFSSRVRCKGCSSGSRCGLGLPPRL